MMTNNKMGDRKALRQNNHRKADRCLGPAGDRVLITQDVFDPQAEIKPLRLAEENLFSIKQRDRPVQGAGADVQGERQDHHLGSATQVRLQHQLRESLHAGSIRDQGS